MRLGLAWFSLSNCEPGHTNQNKAPHGRLRTAAEYGPDIKLPDLLREIAQCPKWGSMHDACAAQYALSSRMES
jgi:hypothetical protein